LIVKSHFLHVLFKQKMSESTSVPEKQLCVGAQVSGNIKPLKRMRIIGVVQEA
jgi:hypothetical protein